MKKYFVAVLFLLFISGFSQNIDINILKDINLNRHKQLDCVFRGITNSCNPIAFIVPLLLFGIGLKNKDSIIRQHSYYIGASVLLSEILSDIEKFSIHRPRPYVTYPFIERITSGGSPSFPSGHTSVAFALAISLSFIYPKWYVIIPAFAWAGVVGYSRMILGVHYPSDILMGAIIAAASAYLCRKGQQWLK